MTAQNNARKARKTKPPCLTHLDARGRAQMVDVGGKTPTRREAVAAGRIEMSSRAFALISQNDGAHSPKGDALAAARIAAIFAAKRAAEWIPLCHILPLESVRVNFAADNSARAVVCKATVSATAKTGVEMEALVAVQAGLLTIYDMLKSADKTMRITDIRLLQKRGGKSGDFIARGDKPRPPPPQAIKDNAKPAADSARPPPFSAKTENARRRRQFPRNTAEIKDGARKQPRYSRESGENKGRGGQ